MTHLWDESLLSPIKVLSWLATRDKHCLHKDFLPKRPFSLCSLFSDKRKSHPLCVHCLTMKRFGHSRYFITIVGVIAIMCFFGQTMANKHHHHKKMTKFEGKVIIATKSYDETKVSSLFQPCPAWPSPSDKTSCQVAKTSS